MLKSLCRVFLRNLGSVCGGRNGFLSIGLWLIEFLQPILNIFKSSIQSTLKTLIEVWAVHEDTFEEHFRRTNNSYRVQWF